MLTIAAAREAARTGSATALAEQHYALIARQDGPPSQDAPEGLGINSFLALSRERALAQATRVDAQIARGEDPGPLAGVPIAIKDVLAMTGAPATAGSKILKGYLPPYDATAVTRLEAAGAVLLGKLNCDEFAMGSSNENSAYGAVRNPRALDRVPGGSSGGSAAAVAAGFAAATLGTDTGGSIRQPAAFCGVVRVGPFTANVRDAATMLSVLAGKDSLDATSSDRPVDDYAATLNEPIRGLRVGVPAEYFEDGLDPEIRASIEAVLDGLRAQGCELVKLSMPHTRYGIPAYYVLATAEASSNLSRFDGVRFGPRAPEGTTLSAMFRKTREEGFGAEVKRRILLGTYVLSAGYYDAYYRKAQQVRTLVTRDFLQAFERCDVMIGPMTPTPPFKLGEKTDDPLAMYLADVYSVAASLAGVCGMSVPCGTTKEGLPIGVQVMARHFGESTMLQVGQAIESMQSLKP
jgi:aspartyl-tRNA(Asn)/glutamyl-tRNA(Gln) amidotransferase subunit A